MADYYGTTLCRQPFGVKTPNKFEKLLKKYGLRKEGESDGELWYSRDGDKFEIYGYSSLQFYDGEKDMNVEPASVIQPYLLPGEIAAFMEVGNTKCRYDESNGYGLIISPKKVRYMCLYNWIDTIAKKMRNEDIHPRIKK